MIKIVLLVSVGFWGGLWMAWPGISTKRNWDCAKDIVLNSNQKRTDLRAVMAISPKVLFKMKKASPLQKMRIVGDSCFR
tara:strand:- start:47 stop:283 length:237 start_codon:yes stop_codon:yes gene_type:complete